MTVESTSVPAGESTEPELALLEMVRAKRARIYDEARPEAVAAQREAGKKTARERVTYLLDDGSFDEVGTLVEPRRDTPPLAGIEAVADGVVAGYGEIDGRPVGVVATDYTVLGGGFSTVGGLKVESIAQRCLKHGFPMIQLFDSGGHRIQEALESRHSASGTGNWMHFRTQAKLSGWVPMANAILGPGFAGPSNFSAMADMTVMVRGMSTMGAAGPALVEIATGEKIGNEELGGTTTQVDTHGVAELALDSEEEALDSIRRFLGFLPTNAAEQAPVIETNDPIDRQSPSLRTVVPASLRRAYDVKKILREVLDVDSMFELKPTYAKNLITALGRLGGRPVGVVANQPMHLAGAITSAACEKAARFISLCDAFGIPLLFFIDTPGLLVGTAAEQQQIVLRSGRVVYELGMSSVPKISIALRKGYGLGYVLMGGGRECGADEAYIWPTAHICGMQVEGAVDVAYRKKIAAADDPEAERKRIIEMYEAQVGVLEAAESFAVDDVIDPADTRRILYRALSRTADRSLDLEPPRRHGISPI